MKRLNEKSHEKALMNFCMFLSLYTTDYLIGLAFWAIAMRSSMWLGVGPKGTNKTLAPMGLGFFCQLLTSPKLPLIIFNTTRSEEHTSELQSP